MKRNFVSTNEFRPLLGSSSAAGRSQTIDSASGVGIDSGANYATRLRNLSSQRLDELGLAYSNPPFDSMAAGRIIGSLREQRMGSDVRISRGYIRRSVINESDPTSKYRLYFMFNPEVIERRFVSYLDQAALDPFNTIFGSQNLVAPPGVLDFSFDLFFDRQTENANGSMPRGVLVDYDYFDLVVRGVVPDPQTPVLPDNGILLVNPRNITAVFSPQLSVQGRVSGARVSYEKFDHRMRPVRMRVSISMQAYYIGPIRDDFTFSQSDAESKAEAVVPYDESIKVKIVPEDVIYKADRLPDVTSFASSLTSKFPGPLGGSPTATGNTAKYPITSGYGPRNGRLHAGIDFGCPNGTPALAPVAGEIVRTTYEPGFGNYVVMHTDDGLALIWGHLDSFAVSVGQRVSPLTVVGYTDNTGSSTGPHLHFEIREGSEAGGPIDCTPYIAGGWQVLG